MEWQGTLAADGEARARVLEDGHLVPVLCLEVISPTGQFRMHVEQPFPAGDHRQAEAAARRYRKGQQITVQAPARSMRFSVTASHIHTNHTEEPTQ